MQQRLSKNAVLEEKSVILVLIRERVKRKSSITKSRTFVNRSRCKPLLRKENGYLTGIQNNDKLLFLKPIFQIVSTQIRKTNDF